VRSEMMMSWRSDIHFIGAVSPASDNIDEAFSTVKAILSIENHTTNPLLYMYSATAALCRAALARQC